MSINAMGKSQTTDTYKWKARRRHKDGVKSTKTKTWHASDMNRKFNIWTSTMRNNTKREWHLQQYSQTCEYRSWINNRRTDYERNKTTNDDKLQRQLRNTTNIFTRTRNEFVPPKTQNKDLNYEALKATNMSQANRSHIKTNTSQKQNATTKQ